MAADALQTLIWIISVGLLNAANHLLNLFAPAAALAVLLVLGGRLCLRQCPSPHTVWWQMAVQAVLGGMVLVAGLALWGRDGKMLTYAALVLAGATCQWVLQRAWRSGQPSKKRAASA